MSAKPPVARGVWTAKEAADYLGFTVATVQAMLRRKELHGVRLGGEWRIRKADVEAIFWDRPSEKERRVRAMREVAGSRPSLARLANVVASGGDVG